MDEGGVELQLEGRSWISGREVYEVEASLVMVFIEESELDRLWRRF